jgi:hypothetical protein
MGGRRTHRRDSGEAADINAACGQDLEDSTGAILRYTVQRQRSQNNRGYAADSGGEESAGKRERERELCECVCVSLTLPRNIGLDRAEISVVVEENDHHISCEE